MNRKGRFPTSPPPPSHHPARQLDQTVGRLETRPRIKKVRKMDIARNKLQTPTSTIQRSLNTKTPSINLQVAEKLQMPSSESNLAFVWDLGLGGSLDVGCWGLTLSLQPFWYSPRSASRARVHSYSATS